MTEQVDELLERLYRLAKTGNWTTVLAAVVGERELAGLCSRYRRHPSGWTFLHQAAYFGHEDAARALIRMDSATKSTTSDGETPADVAERRGHQELAGLLRSAAEHAEGLWEPSADPNLLPSSNAWSGGAERRALHEMRVAYGGDVVTIPSGARYFVDAVTGAQQRLARPIHELRVADAGHLAVGQVDANASPERHVFESSVAEPTPPRRQRRYWRGGLSRRY